MVVTISYFSLDSAGGSGYLGAFLAGLIAANMEHMGLEMQQEHELEMRRFAANSADLVTFFVFLVLGANIPFGVLGDNLLPALAVIGVLVLVARPLAVLACTGPDRRGAWTSREIAFLCWTRETGVCHGSVPRRTRVPDIDTYAAVVSLAIIMTLVLQALPAGWLADKLGLLDGPKPVVPEPDPSPP
jgi:cell volume regulation protein A